MLKTFQYPRFAYRPAPELQLAGRTGHHPVVVVGAGPVGLAAAIDLAQHGVHVVLLDDDNTVSIGSRGLCYAKRTLEILDRLGCGQAVVDKGVTWNVGRTFFRDEEVFRFNLQPEADHQRPGMVNLQQYHLEDILVRRVGQCPLIDLRWQHKVVGVTPLDEGAHVEVDTADGRYTLLADWLVVADGARSPVRHMMGLDMEGKVFKDRFLIADVVMEADFPAERWFWFDPPFHPGQSVLLHREADNVWRIDFQLGWDADPEEEKKPERVLPRIQAMLGPDRTFELEWVSVYTFQCRRMERFRHGRVLFVGDAAHQVSPFGARGANSGLQDIDNLAWKLKWVMTGCAPQTLLDSYSMERVGAAEENLRNSTRSTDFITPKSEVSRDFRNAVLGLARDHAFARALVNSGRLSVPTHLNASPLNTPDTDAFAGRMHPGAPLDDAPVCRPGQRQEDRHEEWLLPMTGQRFVLIVFASEVKDLTPQAQAAWKALSQPNAHDTPVDILVVLQQDGDAPADLNCVVDIRGIAAKRLDARSGTAYLLRPDQHVAARWRQLRWPEGLEPVRAATRRALGEP